MKRHHFIKRLFLLLCLPMLLAGGACRPDQKVPGKPTPNPDLFYPDTTTEPVEPDPNQYLKLTVLDEGEDIFAPCKDWGYRYGPSLMTYADGSIDAWFAAPGTDGEWDWITYQHYDPETKNWSDEVSALQPTPDSMDWLSCCDPGVIYFNGYYYLGYTSTIDDTLSGVRNNVYVARSQYPDGPYEKWNGSGWGGRPQPIIYFDEDSTQFGAGEPSFVLLNGTLYIYYTWKSVYSNKTAFGQTRVATADATRDDWPATIEYKGIALTYESATEQDSTDVKYIEDYGKFIAVCTDKRFTPQSRIAVYESNDGVTFQRVNELRSNLVYRLHNAGISARPNGHINLADPIYIGYAYGEDWGKWGTRIHPVQIALTDEPDLSDGKNNSLKQEVVKWEVPKTLWTVGITAIPHFYEYNLSSYPFEIGLFRQDTTFSKEKLIDPSLVTFHDYNKNIIKIEGFQCTPLSVGETFVTATYDGRSITFPVIIREDSILIDDTNPQIASFTAMQETYTLSLSAKEQKQIRGMAVYDNLSWNEIFRGKDGVTYSDFDTNLIRVSPDGIVQARRETGNTTVRVTCGDQSFLVKIYVID